MDDLERLASWIEPLIRKLSPAERTRLMRHLARGLRQRNQVRIRQQTNPEGSAFAPRKPRLRRKSGRLRQGPMFRGLRKARYLKVVADANSAGVSILGRAGNIAAKHYQGGRDRVSEQGPYADYPSRRVLGFSADDDQWIMDTVLAFLEGSL